MRYLVFGDVHGNLPALEKMLAAEKHNYDVMISHGDVVNYGPWSNECVELLQQQNCICLRGNHEDYFLNGFYPGQNTVAKSFFEFCYPLFRRHDIIACYGNNYEIPGYRIAHTLNNQYIYPDSDVADLQLDTNYIIGHSHYPFFREADGFQLYNTGSVGQNRRFINVINYVMTGEKHSAAEIKSLTYNVRLVTDKMIEQGYPSVCTDYYLKKQTA